MKDSTVLHIKAETFACWLQIKPVIEPIAKHENWLLADAYHWWVFEEEGRTWDASLYNYLADWELNFSSFRGTITVLDCAR